MYNTTGQVTVSRSLSTVRHPVFVTVTLHCFLCLSQLTIL